MRGFSKKRHNDDKSRQIDTVIGANAVFAGVLLTQNSICIEGGFKGRLKCESHVILNKSATIEADIIAEYISVHGKVTGNITALKHLNIGTTGIIRGDVKAAAITIDKGGTLNGTCKMMSEQQVTEGRSSLAAIENVLPNGKLIVSKNNNTQVEQKTNPAPQPHPAAASQPEAAVAMAES
jgi:cytoskeletal protein CcmA (bactofilin family)